MVVRIGTTEAARLLNVTEPAIDYVRNTGKLVAVRTKPFRFALDKVEALRVEREGKPKQVGARTASSSSRRRDREDEDHEEVEPVRIVR